jgi:ankyrin repeat protein
MSRAHHAAPDQQGSELTAQEKHFPLVDLFLIRGADPNRATNGRAFNEGSTALHMASFEGIFEIAESLLEAGANMDQVDEKIVSPLLLAAQQGVIS